MAKELLLIRVDRANLRVDLDAMTALVQRLKEDVGKLLSNLFMEIRMTQDNMVEAVMLKIQENLVEGWKNMETYFQLDSTRLAGSKKDELLRQLLDIQSSK